MNDRPLRVCFAIDNLSRAGTEQQLLALVRGLDRAVVRPYLCLLQGNGEASRRLEPPDCPVLRLGARSLHRPSILWHAWRFARFVRREHIDIVQAHFVESTFFAVPVAWLAGVRHIVRTRRNLGYWVTPLHRFVGRCQGRLVSATIANCDACRQAVVEQEGARPESVTVIENAVDLEPFAGITPGPVAPSSQPRRVGMVANLRPVKGIDVFLRAAGLLKDRHPEVTFAIAGAGDLATAGQASPLVQASGPVALAGSTDDVPGFLAGLDVAVLASHSEGLSNALLEYMAAARPIVATAVGGNTELIHDGREGLLVPPGDPAAMAEAIHRLLSDAELATRLGAAARRRVALRNGPQTMVRNHEAFYLRLAGLASLECGDLSPLSAAREAIGTS